MSHLVKLIFSKSWKDHSRCFCKRGRSGSRKEDGVEDEGEGEAADEDAGAGAEDREERPPRPRTLVLSYAGC